MTQPVNISVYDVIGSPLAVASGDGQLLCDKIFPLLKEGTPVALSFAGVDLLISAFLSTAIGQLYGDDWLVEDNRIDKLLTYQNINEDDRNAINRAVRNAKAYFSNPEAYDRAWAEELGEDSWY